MDTPTSTMDTETNDNPSMSSADAMNALFPPSRSFSPNNDTAWIDVDASNYPREYSMPDRTRRMIYDRVQPSMEEDLRPEYLAAYRARLRQNLVKEELAAATEDGQKKTTKLPLFEELIPDHEAKLDCLNAGVAELIVNSQLSSTRHIPDRPLVMRIDVWVGGENGTDVELALVKMNPDTPFKIVLETLRDQHPLKALKQKSTGRYIFDSDTPACLGFKDGEELVFIQQNDEPMFMLDATMDEVTVWRGKDSRISWRAPESGWPSSGGEWPC